MAERMSVPEQFGRALLPDSWFDEPASDVLSRYGDFAGDVAYDTFLDNPLLNPIGEAFFGGEGPGVLDLAVEPIEHMLEMGGVPENAADIISNLPYLRGLIKPKSIKDAFRRSGKGIAQIAKNVPKYTKNFKSNYVFKPEHVVSLPQSITKNIKDLNPLRSSTLTFKNPIKMSQNILTKYKNKLNDVIPDNIRIRYPAPGPADRMYSGLPSNWKMKFKDLNKDDLYRNWKKYEAIQLANEGVGALTEYGPGLTNLFAHKFLGQDLDPDAFNPRKTNRWNIPFMEYLPTAYGEGFNLLATPLTNIGTNYFSDKPLFEGGLYKDYSPYLFNPTPLEDQGIIDRFTYSDYEKEFDLHMQGIETENKKVDAIIDSLNQRHQTVLDSTDAYRKRHEWRNKKFEIE